jgi:hypothetical protein
VICFAAQTHAAWLIHPVDQVTRLVKRNGPAGGHVPTFAATAIAVGSAPKLMVRCQRSASLLAARQL